MPEYVKPIEYHLTMDPNLKTGRFNGNVKIYLNITKATDTITLHSHLLNIHSVEFKANSKIQVSWIFLLKMPFLIWLLIKKNFLQAKYTISPKEQFLNVILSQIVPPSDTYSLEISFNGDLTDRIVGFYRSSYTSANKEQRYIYYIF